MKFHQMTRAFLLAHCQLLWSGSKYDPFIKAKLIRDDELIKERIRIPLFNYYNEMLPFNTNVFVTYKEQNQNV